MSAAPNRLETLRTLKIANADAAMYTAFATLMGGTFIIGFIKHLGAADIWVGLFAAIPSILGLLQIPGGVWGRSFPTFKGFVFPGRLAWVLLYAPLIALPALPISDQAKLYLLAFLVAIASASLLLITPILNEWLAYLVPASSRGFFFSRRNAIATAVGSVVGLGAAMLLDWFRSRGMEATGFTTVFSIGLGCGAVSLILFTKMDNTPRPDPVKQSFREAVQSLAKPFVDRNFRRVLVFLSVFIGAQAFAGTFFAAYAIESLNLPFTILQWAGVMHAVGNVISAGLWGFLSDKYGNKPILMISGFGLTVTPLMWLFTYPDQTLHNALVLLPSHIIVGMIWAGVALCQYNLLLATAAPEDRANYMSVALTLQAIVGFVAPLLGAQILTVFRYGFDAAEAYKALFIVTMGLRFISVFFLRPVKEEGALQVGSALRDLSRVTPRGFRAMRKLSRSADVVDREQAIKGLAKEGYALGADEVAKALHDPSPRIRRQAAIALTKFPNARATDELIHQITEHPDLVEEETVAALGQLGDPRAVPALVSMLESPKSIVRRAAAKALARVGSRDAINPLLNAARDPSDPDLRRASLQALRTIGAQEAEEVICDALLDPLPSVRIAAAEAVSELELRNSLECLRRSIEYYEDEASSEVAYALGAVGEEQDLPAILAEAKRSNSVITRRRCLLGVARLLGVEREAYKLLLLDGMPRDRALMDMLRDSLKGDKRLRDALQMFASGDEAGALAHLAQGRRHSNLAALADTPVEELFLVAACKARHAPP
jgi:HEAT repeat protein